MDRDEESQLSIRNKQRRKIEASVQEAFKKLRMLQDDPDITKAHAEADNVLCNLLVSLGFEDLIREYRKISKQKE